MFPIDPRASVQRSFRSRVARKIQQQHAATECESSLILYALEATEGKFIDLSKDGIRLNSKLMVTYISAEDHDLSPSQCITHICIITCEAVTRGSAYFNLYINFIIPGFPDVATGTCLHQSDFKKSFAPYLLRKL